MWAPIPTGWTWRAVAAGAAIVGILVLATALRLWRLDLVEFKDDEAMGLRLTEDIVRLGRIPLAGLTTSLGVQNPAIFLYLMAPVVTLSREPIVASAAVGLFNVAGVAGVLALGWRWLSPLGGLAAGLAYATNPWAVFYSRKIWNADILAPWVVLFFLAFDRALVADSHRWAVLLFPIFAIAAQIHQSMLVLIPLLIGLAVVLVTRRCWTPLALGLGLASLTTVPYLLHLYQTSWRDLQVLSARLGRPAAVDVEGPRFALGLATGWQNWSLASFDLEQVLSRHFVLGAAAVETALLGLGLVLAVVTLAAPGCARPGTRVRRGALLLWLLLPAVLTIRHSYPLWEHYYVWVPAAAALVIGAGVAWLAARPDRPRRAALGVAFGSLVVVAALHTTMVLRVLDQVAIGYEPEYGPPLARSEALAREVVGFGSHARSQHLIVELKATYREPTAYLARPYFPMLDLERTGPVGLGERLSSAQDVEDPPASAFLGPIQPLTMSYPDGVEGLAAATFTHQVAGQDVSMALSWLFSGAAPINTGVQWRLALFDASEREVSGETGVLHTAQALAPGEPIVSWLTLSTSPDAPAGPYQLRLRRVDHETERPLPFMNATGVQAVEWRSPPIQLDRPASG